MLILQNIRLRIFGEFVVYGMTWIIYYIAYSLVNTPLIIVIYATFQTTLLALTFHGVIAIQKRIRKRGGAWTWWTGILIYSVAVIYLKLLVAGQMLDESNPFAKFIFDRFQSTPLIPIINVLVPLISGILFEAAEFQFKKEQQNLKLLNELQNSQLQYLKAQINPHFLFNTLNNIYSLTIEQSPVAPLMILRLADLLRYAIYDGEKLEVPLKKEVEQLEKLIELYQLRSSKVRNIELLVEGQLEGISIEPMLLVPIVENSLKHGDLSHNPKGFAKFRLQVDGKTLRFESENTYSTHGQKDTVGGVGLKNIKGRLAIRHPNEHFFEIIDHPPIFKVKLEIGYGNTNLAG